MTYDQAYYTRSVSHRTPSPEAIADIESLREGARLLVDLIHTVVPPGRERSLALTHFEESVMWAVKGIVLNEPATFEEST